MSDVCPTVDQVTDLISTRPGNFVEIDHEIFPTVNLFLPLIQEGQLSFWQKNVHKYWLTT